MNLSEVLTGKVISGTEAEPIVDRAGNVLAVKIRTHSAAPGGGLRQVGRSTKTQKKKLLKDQLTLIDLKTAYFQNNNILCSINIDFDMALLLIQDEEIAELAKSKPFLRLEILEGFPNLSDGRSNCFLQVLAEEYRLWLGDFGSGESNLRALQENLFDAVRIDNDFFKIYRKSGIWPVIIKNIMRYCKFIIIEGVESIEQCHTIEMDIKALQGGCFKSVRFETIENLNKKFIF
ncbi:MAG: EAL domain-containing protein [Pantoea dispersa]|uniref:EAL domain-containing protein n=1 Tax=Pantoea dispersa TaxID=59814 RepID=UPI0028590BA7|nr:EAL domain-containing protein [Pantoea dispersa]MDR6295901.1 EAL domain-containing protein (putative c-di-GMP-specific phosphodiesterase class I) [Pantoea dispersa]